MGRKIEVKPGDRYGRLTVIEEAEPYISPNGKRRRCFACRCDCGETATVLLESLASGATRSCRCLQREVMAHSGHKNTTHGQTGSLTYKSWDSMRQRCCNPSDKDYPRYGGRGITVCQGWMGSFENFLADMGERPSCEYTIDRYPDQNGDYEKSNCRWATQKQQQRNRRSNVMVSFQGQEHCISEWAEQVGLTTGALWCRLKNGWTTEEALTLPPKAKRAS